VAPLTPFQQAIKRLSDGDVDAARQALVAIWEGGGSDAGQAARFIAHIAKNERRFSDAIHMLESSLETLGKDAATLAQLSELFMAVGNSRLAGGGYEVAPEAVTDDGLLDLAVIQHGGGVDLARLKEEIEKPGDPDNRFLYYRQLAEFTLESERDMHFNLDGEPILTPKVTFSVLPQHLGVVF